MAAGHRGAVQPEDHPAQCCLSSLKLSLRLGDFMCLGLLQVSGGALRYWSCSIYEGILHATGVASCIRGYSVSLDMLHVSGDALCSWSYIMHQWILRVTGVLPRIREYSVCVGLSMYQGIIRVSSYVPCIRDKPCVYNCCMY